jgi:hypothetical protein
MRKLLVFVVSAVMIVGGLYLLGVELLLAERIYLRSIIVGAMLVAAGGYFLWTDFIALKGNG